MFFIFIFYLCRMCHRNVFVYAIRFEKERKIYDFKIAIARSCRFASLMIGLIFYWIFIV